MTDRLSLVTTAVRPPLKAKMLLSGPTGAGKTKTALMVATELGGVPLLIDTEKESALTYADEFAFRHLPWREPFDPAELTEVLRDERTARYPVVIIDSLTHFWRGHGGTLDIAEGKFSGWKVAGPIQESLVRAILEAPFHVILCTRAKMDYRVTEEVQANGRTRQVVEKLGIEPVQSPDLAYELNVQVDIDMAHVLTVTKTRTSVLPIGRTFRAGRNDVVEFARTYADWLAGGEPLLGREEADALVEMFDELPGTVDRRIAKQAFVQAFARPEQLQARQLDDARQWITDYLRRGSAPDLRHDEDDTPDEATLGEAQLIPTADAFTYAADDEQRPFADDDDTPATPAQDATTGAEAPPPDESPAPPPAAPQNEAQSLPPMPPRETVQERAQRLAQQYGPEPRPPEPPPEQGARVRAPSAADLAREGVTTDEVAAVYQELAPLRNPDIGARLSAAGLALGGGKSDRLDRLVNFTALQRHKDQPPATITALIVDEGLIPDGGPPPFVAHNDLPGACPICGSGVEEPHDDTLHAEYQDTLQALRVAEVPPEQEEPF